MSTACIILAAGRGSRMGERNKAILRRGSESFLECIARTCRAANVEEICVVVAEPHGEATRQEAQRLGLRCLENPAPERGMASSIALAFAHALSDFHASHCWLWPVDTPAVSPASVRTLLARADEAAIVIPCFAGRGGHPSLMARAVWAELAACGDLAEGARSVLRRDPARVLRVEMQDAAVVQDVDEPIDLEILA